MKISWQWPIIIMLLGGASLWGGQQLYHSLANQTKDTTIEQPQLGMAMPEFSLPDIDGKLHNISDWQGKVIVLNFWATWCPPCVREIPLFVELQERYASQGLQFVGIAIDELQAVRDFSNTYGINYPNLIGAQDAVEIAKKYGNRLGTLPYTVVINRQGNIAFIQLGEFKREIAEKTIKSLL